MSEAVIARLLDFSQPMDVALLDATVSSFYAARSNEERVEADKVLNALKSHPDTWTRVDAILSQSTNQQTRFFALAVLEDTCRFKWGALPPEQRDGIRNFVSNSIISISTNEASFTKERVHLNKLNVILVSILKHDWPAKWPSFIPDLMLASKQSETLCENTMVILKLLSEEIFDFSKDELIQAKVKTLKASLNTEFARIHELCVFVLHASCRPSLLQATLTTLHSYLSWVPLMYVFEGDLVQHILTRLFPEPMFRNNALKCLTEVAGLTVSEEHDGFFVGLYQQMMEMLTTRIIPQGVDIRAAYSNGTDEDQTFVSNLALFLTSYFKSHLTALESSPPLHPLILDGLELLMRISYVDDNEVFKTCLELWRKFAHDLYMKEVSNGSLNASLAGFGGGGGGGNGGVAGLTLAPPTPSTLSLYQPVLRALRLLMIQRMAKPEEVIIVIDENGNVVREVLSNQKDNLDVLQQHKVMQDTLKYLTYLNYQETHHLMLDALSATLQQQIAGLAWDREALNTLCWAIGAIAGCVAEDEAENRFLVNVIKDLLVLCEKTKGKDNKAVVASNIMYVVGQYPRFLNNHWKFLKTVVYKLFEFMHESHPGVQDMSCDTFMKIVQRCTRRFVTNQAYEQATFLEEVLFQEEVHADLSRSPKFCAVMSDLEPQQRHRFIEALAYMMQAMPEETKVPRLLSKLMEPTNMAWEDVLRVVSQDRNVLRDAEVVKRLNDVLLTNVAACTSLGAKFLPQLELVYSQLLSVYQAYSELIQVTIAEAVSKGIPAEHAARYSIVRQMRSFKKNTLKLIETFAEKCELADRGVLAPLVPALLTPVLEDYRLCPQEEAREPDVLSCLAALIEKMGDQFQPFVPAVLQSTFQVTLDMITRNMEEYPEHRLKFFAMLRAITLTCFNVLFEMSAEQLQLVMNSIIWAFRHTERNVAEVGLNLLFEMLQRFADEGTFCTQFHRTYYRTLLHEVFAVLTDSFHKPGFKLHAKILHHLFGLVLDPGRITAPLWEGDAEVTVQPTNNLDYVRQHVSNLLHRSFPNMNPNQIKACVDGFFQMTDYTAFKQHLRDFLVLTKNFTADELEVGGGGGGGGGGGM